MQTNPTIEQTPPDCAHCSEPIHGDLREVMGVRMHPDCEREFRREYDEYQAEIALERTAR